jgi:beta-lactamase regulating signal transducer with metallopeptidase domain
MVVVLYWSVVAVFRECNSVSAKSNADDDDDKDDYCTVELFSNWNMDHEAVAAAAAVAFPVVVGATMSLVVIAAKIVAGATLKKIFYTQWN